jgi:hypothetical protein
MLALMLMLPSACNRKPALTFTNEAPALAPGTAPFPMDWRTVSDLEVFKNDPNTGDHWHASLQKREDIWVITTASTPTPLKDSRADTRYVGHLLDTLSTLRVQDWALNGPPESFGLDRPRWVLKWKTDKVSHELRIGDASTGAILFAAIPGRTDAQGTARTVTIAGAAIEMLARLDEFTALRARVLLPFDSDDIDLLTLKSPARKITAKREGGDWQNETPPPLKLDITATLEELTHLRARRIIDAENEEERHIRESLEKSAPFEARFTDRSNHVSVLRAGRFASLWYATLNDRNGVLFELHPESERILR